jgi:4-hydroxy-tetrahydrodipicolinate reductase
VGVFLAPNLTIVGQLMFRCAEVLRPYFGDVEIVEMHNSAKRDAPSGTALETAHRINAIPAPPPTKDQTSRGIPEARGGVSGEVRIHSVRLPSFYSRHEVLFAKPGQMLTIVCDQFTTEPLIGPTLKAAKLLLAEKGVVRDLPGLFDPD